MTPTTTPRSGRRTARTAAIGAVALTAAVALPAFAIDRGGDGTVEASTGRRRRDESPHDHHHDRPGPGGLWLEAKSVDESLAAIATLTPEQQFALLSEGLDPRADGRLRPDGRRRRPARVLLRLRGVDHGARPRPRPRPRAAKAAATPRQQQRVPAPRASRAAASGTPSLSARPAATGHTRPSPVASPVASCSTPPRGTRWAARLLRPHHRPGGSRSRRIRRSPNASSPPRAGAAWAGMLAQAGPSLARIG